MRRVSRCLSRVASIARAAANPLARALRPDKLVLAALAATLDLHLSGRREEIPFYRMLGAPLDRLQERAERLAEEARAAGWDAEVVPSTAIAGGGAGAGVAGAELTHRRGRRLLGRGGKIGHTNETKPLTRSSFMREIDA